MTDETNKTEDENEQMYDYPEYRESADGREFIEGEVGAFLDAETDGDYVEYDGYAVAAEAVHSLSEHDYHSRVQLDVLEYEINTHKCSDCGEEYQNLALHHSQSDCSSDGGADD